MRSARNRDETAAVAGRCGEAVGVAHVVGVVVAVHRGQEGQEALVGTAHLPGDRAHRPQDVGARQDRMVEVYPVGNHRARAEACRFRGSSPDGSV